MSDYHILTQGRDKKTINVLFHIPIPATGTNDVGISWQAAVVREQGGADAISSNFLDISAEELSALKAGSIVEKQVTVRFSSTILTNAQRLQEIKNTFNTMKTEFVSEKQIDLAFIGYAGNV